MKVFKIRTFTFLLLVFSANMAFSQELPDVLSLEEVLKITLEKNFDVKIAEKNTAISENNASLGNAGFLPSINANGAYTYTRNNSVLTEFSNPLQSPIEATGAVTQGSNAGVSLNYTLFNGRGRTFTLRRLENSRDLTMLAERQNIEMALVNVMNQYFNTINAYNSLLTNSLAISISQDRFIRANENYAYGNMGKLELLNAQVDLSNDSSSLIQAKNNYDNSRFVLCNLMGVAPDNSFDVDTALGLSGDLDLASFLTAALENNSQFLQQKALMTNSEYDIQINNAQKLPTLSLSSGYNFARTEFQGNFLQLQQSRGWNAGLTLSYNIYNGNQVNRNEQNARISREIQSFNIEKFKINLEKDVTVAFNNYEANRNLVELTKRNLELARTNYERSEQAFATGQITGIELREAQLNLLNAEFAIVAQKVQTKLAEVNLFYLSGSLVE